MDIDLLLGVPASVALFLLLAACVWVEARDRSPLLLMWLFVGAIYVIPSIGDMINGQFVVQYRGVIFSNGRRIILLSQVFFGLVMAAYLLVLRGFKAAGWDAGQAQLARAHDPSAELAWLMHAGIVYTLGCGLWLYQQYGIGALELTFMDFQQDIPYWVMFGLQAFPKFYVGTLLWFLIQRRWGVATGLSVLMAAVFFAFGGSRQNLVQIGLVAVLYLLFYSRLSRGQKGLILFGGVPLFAVVFPLLLVLRDSTSFEDRLDLLMHDLPTVFGEGREGGELMLRGVFYHFIRVFDTTPQFGQFHYLLRTLMFWIPTSWSGGLKPDDFEYTMFAAFTGETATMHPTMPGSMFADAGWWALPWVVALVATRQMVVAALRWVKGAGFATAYVCFCAAAALIGRGALYEGILICAMMVFPIVCRRFFVRDRTEAVTNALRAK